jgi:hypothetical protein
MRAIQDRWACVGSSREAVLSGRERSCQAIARAHGPGRGGVQATRRGDAGVSTGAGRAGGSPR